MISNDWGELIKQFELINTPLNIAQFILSSDEWMIFLFFYLFSLSVNLLLTNLNDIMFLYKAVLSGPTPVLPTLLANLPAALGSDLPPAAGVARRTTSRGLGGGGSATHVPAGAAHHVTEKSIPLFLATCPLPVATLLTTPPTTAVITWLPQSATQEMRIPGLLQSPLMLQDLVLRRMKSLNLARMMILHTSIMDKMRLHVAILGEESSISFCRAVQAPGGVEHYLHWGPHLAQHAL